MLGYDKAFELALEPAPRMFAGGDNIEIIGPVDAFRDQ